MHISKKSEYAVLGTLFLACKPRNVYSKIDEVIKVNKMPRALLMKIFNTLVQNNILESKLGSNGGFRLKKAPKDITLFDILNLFESQPYVNDCISESLCSAAKSCSMGIVWRQVQDDVDKVLQNITFKDLIKNATTHSNLIPLSHK
jgi:Rrf2 family protein